MAKGELSAFWHDPETGVLLRCRPDIWVPETGTILDLKSCGDASEHGFPKVELMRNKYHIQSAWYLMGMSVLEEKNLTKHIHICVETDEPYACQLHALNDASLERAMLDIRHGLIKYAHCLATDTWPSLPTGITQIAIPDWSWPSQWAEEQA